MSAIEIVAYASVGAFWAALIGFEWAFRRAGRRSDLWYARFKHRKALAAAASAGETSLEWHAMRCTICGNFHSGDDGDCESEK